MGTRARAKERAGWAKAMRRPRRLVTGAPTVTREAVIVFIWFLFFARQYELAINVTGLSSFSVVGELHALHEE